VVVWTLGEMLQSPSNAATVAALSPAPLRGRYQGLNSLTWSAGTALAPVLGGLTQEHLGNTTLWLGCFGLSAVAAVAVLVSGPSRERRIRLLSTDATPPSPVADPVADSPARAG
jgi:MFS family permease